MTEIFSTLQLTRLPEELCYLGTESQEEMRVRLQYIQVTK